ncbi:hypothetical protein [Streptomyces sp. NPDC059272]|uniref:hypothetical protein n=1 Tax=Streptomyces sp. NPDC059272 TaxID=3346800 RepID=UPI003691E37E
MLHADLERGHRLEAERRAQGGSAPKLLRLATAEVADQVERYLPIYRHALDDPADSGVYEALVRHFSDCTLDFMAAGQHGVLPGANRQVIAQFMARLRGSDQGLARRPLRHEGGPGRRGRGLRSRLVGDRRKVIDRPG